MPDLFISHSSADDAFVRRLRQGLEEHGVQAWIDSRELLPGGLLEPDIARAIESASAFAVVVSPHSLQSKWVGKELRLSLDVQQRRGKDKYRVIPLSLDGTKLGVLESFFDGEPLYVPVSSAAGGVDAAMNSLLVALGKRLPADAIVATAPAQEPLEELRLELTDFATQLIEGESRVSARARVVYESATAGQPPIVSRNSWRLVAPFGQTELGELRWYLDAFARWPHAHFRSRADAVEANLVRWGRQLHDAALPAEHAAQVTTAWSRLELADRRFSVLVDPEGAIEAAATPAIARAARESAAAFLTLPWELLHDGEKHLVEGSRAVCIRRRVPSTRAHETTVMSLPIRVLIVSPRPEDETCEYFDHRASTLPLISSLERLGEIVRLRTLTPPTLAALRIELDRARSRGEPYHVIHFDGYVAFDPTTSTTGLCFEESQDLGRVSKRRHARVLTSDVGTLLRDQRVPVVFLDARPTEREHFTLESLASELLQGGVGSIVTTMHPALEAAARRFVTAFYGTLAAGGRTGDAVLEGQRQLKDDNSRGSVLGAEVRIQDWFNPILYQHKDDPALLHSTPSRQTEADIREALLVRLGELPASSRGGFVGRSRGLLALERLLHHASYALLRGPVGSGKTALAVEFARWMVRSRRVERAALVTLGAQTTPKALVTGIARQLIGARANPMATDDMEPWLKQVERALLERSTLVVIDDVDRMLPPADHVRSEVSVEQADSAFAAIAAVCLRLLAIEQTRIVFASRESLPAPFDGSINRLEVMPLPKEEAVEIVERQLTERAIPANRTDIEELAELFYGHAGTLARLGGPLLDSGIAQARTAVDGFLIELDRRHPGDDHLSPLAAVEHALSRMSTASQTRALVLAPFQGGVQAGLLRDMTGWGRDEVIQLVSEIVERGLGTLLNESYVALVPGVSSYLRRKIGQEELTAFETRWRHAIREYGAFLLTTGRQDAVVTSERFALDIPNFLALLEYDERVGDTAMAIGTASSLIPVLSGLGKQTLVARVTRSLKAAVERLRGNWSHAHFAALDAGIQQLLDEGRITKACEAASGLLQIAKTAGLDAYDDAEFDIAMACYLFGRALGASRREEEALSVIDEARSRFESVQREQWKATAARMAVACGIERADCLAALNRLDEAAAMYQECIERSTELKEERSAAVAAAQLGTVRRRQGRYAEALEAIEVSRRTFSRLNEPASVAQAYAECGRAYVALERYTEAESAYRQALEIWVQRGNRPGEARELNALATLSADHLNRPQDAIAFYARAAEIFAGLGDAAGEAHTRNNLADTLSRLGRLDEGRSEIERVIECKKPFGHSLQPWTSWDILACIESGAGNANAAARARRAALDAYLSYRREGGQADGGPSKLTTEIERQIQAHGVAAALDFLTDLRADANSSPELRLFCDVLVAILNGKRDPAMVAAAGLNYAATAEAILFIEHLEGGQRSLF